MPAYVISEVEIVDPAAVHAYKPLARHSILEHGGEYLARDAVPQSLEGTFDPGQRLVLIRFDDVETARRWYASESYAAALAAANGGLRRRLFIIDGL
ncbi:MAG: DUF1330 domain-containing protein [Streptosporangiaceae bacterium]